MQIDVVQADNVSTAAVTSSAHNAASSSTTQTSGIIQQGLLAAVYSTTVAGKSYSGDVEATGGVYEASVPNLFGASATGSSIQAAENNLSVRIDALV